MSLPSTLHQCSKTLRHAGAGIIDQSTGASFWVSPAHLSTTALQAMQLVSESLGSWGVALHARERFLACVDPGSLLPSNTS